MAKMVQSAPPLIIAISIYLLVSTCLSVVLNIQPAAAGRNDRPIVGNFTVLKPEIFNKVNSCKSEEKIVRQNRIFLHRSFCTGSVQ